MRLTGGRSVSNRDGTPGLKGLVYASALAVFAAVSPAGVFYPQLVSFATEELSVVNATGVRRGMSDGGPVPALAAIAPPGWAAGELAQVSGAEAARQDPDSAGLTGRMLSEYGLVSIISRCFQRGQRTVVARVYKFASSQGAWGAYLALKRGASAVVPSGDAGSEDDQSVSFCQGTYFVAIYTTAEDDEEAKVLVLAVAGQLSQAIGSGAEKPHVLARLPRLDRIGGSERLVMGPVAAAEFSNLPYLLSLNLAASRGAALADYRVARRRPERLSLMLVDYGSAPLAQSVFKEYTSNLAQAHKGDVAGQTALFKLDRSYLWCQMDGEMLVVITGARQVGSAASLARQSGL